MQTVSVGVDWWISRKCKMWPPLYWCYNLPQLFSASRFLLFVDFTDAKNEFFCCDYSDAHNHTLKDMQSRNTHRIFPLLSDACSTRLTLAGACASSPSRPHCYSLLIISVMIISRRMCMYLVWHNTNITVYFHVWFPTIHWLRPISKSFLCHLQIICL